jgi:hypothetical protein
MKDFLYGLECVSTPALCPKRDAFCSQEDLRKDLHSNVGTTWEHNRRKRGNTRIRADQKGRRDHHFGIAGPVCKTSFPVQRRAAPPVLTSQFSRVCGVWLIGRILGVGNSWEQLPFEPLDRLPRANIVTAPYQAAAAGARANIRGHDSAAFFSGFLTLLSPGPRPYSRIASWQPSRKGSFCVATVAPIVWRTSSDRVDVPKRT